MKFKAFTFILLWAVLALNLVVAARPTDHVSQRGNMVYGPSLKLSAHAASSYTAFERDVRRNVEIGHVFDTWTSPHEGNVVLSKPTGRWHHSQHVRRMN